MNEKLEIFAEKIRAAKSVAIMAHKNLDGDALGSMLAMRRLIELNFGILPVCIYDGNVPDMLDYVPGRRDVCHHTKITNTKYDVVILLDYGTTRHLEFAMPIINAAGFTIEMDHHKNDAPIAELQINDTDADATGIIVYDMMRAFDWNYDADVLTQLAVAILTDTGNFKFVRDSRALRIMAGLVDEGVNVRRVMEILNNKPRRTIVVESRAAANAEFWYKGRLALATVGIDDYKNMDGRGETVLNLLGQVKGVEYVVLLKHQRENQVGISLRSRGAPIDHIAAKFGGGGHPRAAGAVAFTSIENVRSQILELFKGM